MAKQLPSLPTASEITTGTLSNGIEYYLVSNPYSHGYADYALVQKGVFDEQDAREALLSLPRFDSQKPYLFLAGRGVAYPRDGFVKTDRYSARYRFENVPTSDTATSDSTLMMIFDLCARSDREQAIIISGDINAETIKGKMSIFSMLIPKLSDSEVKPQYEWSPSQEAVFRSGCNSSQGVAGITLKYTLPRTPADKLNTVQVYVNDMLYGSLEELLSRRIREAFRVSDLPYANLRFDYADSSRGEDSESFSIQVDVPQDQLTESLETLGRVLASVDLCGVTTEELDAARSAWLSSLGRRALYKQISNREYVDRCISSFLFGTSLSSALHEVSYFGAKDMSSPKQTEVFCSVASAVLDPARNLTLTCRTPQGDVSREEALSAFQSGWGLPRTALSYVFVKGTPAGSLWHDFEAPRKVKLKSQTAEPITGGQMLTFSNGMTVIYKQESSRTDLHFALMVRGGYPYVKGLEAGEGAFVTDMLALYDVGGVDCYNFYDMLESEGIRLVRQAGISDLRCYGTAPSSKMDLVLKTLVKLTTDSSPFREGFDYYRRCEELRLDASHLEERGISAAMDSIMRPDYIFSQYKYAENLKDGLQDKVDIYLKDRFSHLGDGLLVLVGSQDIETVTKKLCGFLGAFQTARGNIIRPMAQYVLRSGGSTFQEKSADGEGVGTYVALSAAVPVTAERTMAFLVASMRLRKALSAALADLGYSPEISMDEEVFPMERYSLLISCRPAPSSGLPAGVTAASPSDVISAVREVICKLSSESVSTADLKIFKSTLLKDLNHNLSSVSAKVNAVMTRYSEGKEMTSRYKDAMNALTASQVQEILQALSSGSRVEYLVY